MTTPLAGSWEKWEWGRKHLDTLNRNFGELVDVSKPYTVPTQQEIEEDSPLTMTVLFRFGPVPNIGDSRFGLMIGDSIQNFRAALDHLAWSLVKRKGTPLSRLKRRQRKMIAFPLAQSKKTFPGRAADLLPGVPGDVIDELVRPYQPYRRGNKAIAMRALRSLSDRDKHRLLIPTFWFPQDGKVKITATGFSIVEDELLIPQHRGFRLKSGAPIARVRVVPTSAFETKVELKAKAAAYPSVGGGLWLFPTLETIRDTVEEVLTVARGVL